MLKTAINIAVRTGVRKGVLGGSNRWLAVGLAAWGLRKARQMGGKQAETVYRAELKPGESLVIDHSVLRHGDA